MIVVRCWLFVVRSASWEIRSLFLKSIEQQPTNLPAAQTINVQPTTNNELFLCPNEQPTTNNEQLTTNNEMPTFTTFEELDCWKASREVVRWVMQITEKFPKEEKFDLKDNMRRAARSSTRNIAEGFGRHHHGENIQHCRIARGSLFEVIDDLITALEEKYITQEEYNHGRNLLNKAINIINGYIKYLNSLL